MNEASNVRTLRSVDELLQRRFSAALAEPAEPDWVAVVRRAEEIGGRRRRARRSRWGVIALAATIAVVAIAAAPALGIGDGFIDFFGSKPASNSARAGFAKLNVVAPSRSALANASKAHEIYVFHLASGEHTLAVAPTGAGSFCWTITYFSDGCQAIVSSHGPYRAGEVSPVKIGLVYTDIPTRAMKQAPVLIGGNVRVAGAQGVQVQFEDGNAATVPLVWVSAPIDAGFFLYELPHDRWSAGRRPVAVAALAADGAVLARADLTVTSTLDSER
jgi:hypothetical protein